MKNFVYENLNKINSQFLPKYLIELKKIFHKESFILGNNVKKFENNFASYLDSKNCVSVNSGLDALFFSLKALNLKTGSEVIVPSNAYVAAVFAIINAGLKPVFVEPKIDTYNIDPNLIVRKISKKTKAIMIVHLYGKTCEMDEILKICKQKKLYLIEDCAQSHGAKYKNKQTGSFGDFGCFSFYPTKNLGAIGDGGAITMKNNSYYKNVLKLRNYGSIKKNNHEILGFNSRLDEIQAAFLNIKLKNLNKINTYKKKLAKVYLENLNDKFIKPSIDKNCENVYHIFPIRFNERDKLKNYLENKKINTLIHYPIPPYLQSFYRKTLAKKYPISSKIHDTILSLPITTIHSESDIYKITKILNKF